MRDEAAEAIYGQNQGSRGQLWPGLEKDETEEADHGQKQREGMQQEDHSQN